MHDRYYEAIIFVLLTYSLIMTVVSCWLYKANHTTVPVTTEMYLRDLPVGHFGFVTPWTLFVHGEDIYASSTASVRPKRGGTVRCRVTRRFGGVSVSIPAEDRKLMKTYDPSQPPRDSLRVLNVIVDHTAHEMPLA